MRGLFRLLVVGLWLSFACNIFAQGTLFHLHKEPIAGWATATLQTTAPDSKSTYLESYPSYKNLHVVPYLDSRWAVFRTAPPSVAGTIPAGSVVTFSVWLKKTANWGTIYPYFKLWTYDNNDILTGNLVSVCDVTGPGELTTTLTKYTLSCSPSVDVALPSTRAFRMDVGSYVTVSPGNHAVYARVYFEGTLNGNYDSTVVIPAPTVPPPPSPPVITGISPTSGGVGAYVTVTGSDFGTPDTSAVSFNGILASPIFWSPTSLFLTVPGGASTGPVLVTVREQPSNAVPFTVLTQGSIVGTVRRASDHAPLTGITVTALQASQLKGAATTDGSGSYVLSGLSAGLYDVAVGTGGYLPVLYPGTLISPSLPATVNFNLERPVISGVSPTGGPEMATVRISGARFGSNSGEGVVSFNGALAAAESWTDTEIVTTVPPGSTSGPLTVTVSGASSNSIDFGVGVGGIRGTVTDADSGLPLGGSEIELFQDVAVSQMTAAGDGTFSFADLIPGLYALRFSAVGRGTHLVADSPVSAGVDLIVNAALSSGATLEGEIRASDGVTPVEGARVDLTRSNVPVAVAFTNAAGHYFNDTAGTGVYDVKISAPGYVPQVKTGVSMDSGVTRSINADLQPVSEVTYTYDARGRLTAVSDALGDTATYSYDANGNLLSIGRYSTAQISITGFVPTFGIPGSSVTIFGTAFGLQPASNTVTFNGTTAQVESAASTQLVVRVPQGATSGPISVVSPSGSATSATSFSIP